MKVIFRAVPAFVWFKLGTYRASTNSDPRLPQRAGRLVLRVASPTVLVTLRVTIPHWSRSA